LTAGHAKLGRLEAVCPIFVSWAQQELRAQRMQIERDQIARARNVGAGSGFVANHDFGPVIRFLRQEVEPEFRPDPNPEVGALVHGGRVRDGLRSMYVRGHITLQQWHAVCAFRDSIDIAAGARPDQPDRITGIRSPNSGARWPDDMQIEALRRVRAAWTAIPPDHRVLTFWAIVAGGTLDDYAKLAGKRRQIVAAMFDFALAIIEEHYGSDATP
jgi:hypothetical protein